ncbi:MAG: hypothetical protein DLM56_02470 [Pseudonocardiales bacterium]|nr:MAG: hypothetical protein DLM56_02470 [Pseudonocardiales bacterium]
MVGHTTVVTSLVGVSAGIAGLTLVFLGLVVTGVRSIQPGTSRDVLRPLRISAGLVVASFAGGIVDTVLGVSWLLAGGDPRVLYLLVAVVFFVQLALLCLAVGRVLSQIVWGDRWR